MLSSVVVIPFANRTSETDHPDPRAESEEGASFLTVFIAFVEGIAAVGVVVVSNTDAFKLWVELSKVNS